MLIVDELGYVPLSQTGGYRLAQSTIGCGYPDGNDFDRRLSGDPTLKLVVRTPA
jgi:hypothetical protein